MLHPALQRLRDGARIVPIGQSSLQSPLHQRVTAKRSQFAAYDMLIWDLSLTGGDCWDDD